MIFESLWAELEPVGRDAHTGGYRRFVYDDADRICREWFVAAAQAQGLDVETDRNGNLWAWWNSGQDGEALVVGSHLDSVDQGGAYDGPLGVISAFAAVERLQQEGVEPSRPIAVVAFADEEGGRFGVPCAGSRLLTGALDPDRARALKDRDGVTMAEAMIAAGHDPRYLGRDDERKSRIGAFVELHIEQGRQPTALEVPVAVGTSIWPHGRYRFTFTGEANHAGTTRMQDRHDPMTAFAKTAVAADALARDRDFQATFGRIEVVPNVTNAIPSEVRAWLDVRAGDDAAAGDAVQDVLGRAREYADAGGVSVDMAPESVTPDVRFDDALRTRVSSALQPVEGDTVPAIPTAAGHDAGILSAAGIHTSMLFVRNPTGISHSPAEHAERADCLAGVAALTAVIEDLACNGGPS